VGQGGLGEGVLSEGRSLRRKVAGEEGVTGGWSPVVSRGRRKSSRAHRDKTGRKEGKKREKKSEKKTWAIFTAIWATERTISDRVDA
jgi:hypothetical protein